MGSGVADVAWRPAWRALFDSQVSWYKPYDPPRVPKAIHYTGAPG